MPAFDLDAALSSNQTVAYLEFPTQAQAYGRGGWGRGAHLPLPKLRVFRDAEVSYTGKSIMVNGVRRLKCNIWDRDGTSIRTDYPNIFLDNDGTVKLV